MEFLWLFVQPSNLLAFLAIVGLVFLAFRMTRTARWLLGTVGVLFLMIVFLPISGALMTALETRFPQPVLPERVDGIIVLGGAVDPRGTARWGQPQLTSRVERLTEGAALARQHPEAVLLFTGGSWRSKDALSESDVARAFFLQIGLDEEQLMFEDRSRSTYQNATFSKKLVTPQDGETWVLVTSAFHMPRAVGVFRHVGWDVIPYPVDYYGKGEVTMTWIPQVGGALASLDFVSREWVALAGYYFGDQSSAFFPAPDPAIPSVTDSD